MACDNTSVGALAKDFEGKILLVEQKKFPFGWAPPSGHLDGQIYQVACFNVFEEKTGLKVIGAPSPIALFKSRKYFKCQRGGEYHDWQIFEVRWQGKLKPNQDETKSIKWYMIDEIKSLAFKTQEYLRRMKLSVQADEESWQLAIQESIGKEWQTNPGLEPVWCEFFQELKII